jgi:hypothetical protein
MSSAWIVPHGNTRTKVFWKHCFAINKRTGLWLKWLDTCLVRVRPWVHFPILKKVLFDLLISERITSRGGEGKTRQPCFHNLRPVSERQGHWNHMGWTHWYSEASCLCTCCGTILKEIVWVPKKGFKGTQSAAVVRVGELTTPLDMFLWGL